MYPDTSDHKCIIVGLQGSGKTYYGKALCKHHKFKTLVYTPHKHDFQSEPDNFIVYQFNDYYKDFEDFIELAICLGKKKAIKCVLIDEFDMLFTSNFDIKRHFNDLTLNHRHYNLSIIGMTRRPQDIPTKFFGSCKYIVTFVIEEPNAINKFNGMYVNWGEQIKTLDFASHEYMVKEIGKPPIKYRP